MKVIEENKSFGTFPMQVKCKRIIDKYGFAYRKDIDFCGSKLEINAEDIKAHDWEKYPDYKGTDYGVVCPICGQFVVISEDKIPKKILETAEKIRLNK